MKTYALVAQEGEPGLAPGEDQRPGGPWNILIIMGLIFGVFYLLLIRPQRKREKERQTKRTEMLSALKKNDHVMTIGGIRGIVSAVGEDEVVLKVDESKDVRLRVSRDAISKTVGIGAEDERENR